MNEEMLRALMQFLPFTFWMLVTIVPSVRLLRRVGMYRALAALNLFPFLGTAVLLWIIAYSRWPATRP